MPDAGLLLTMPAQSVAVRLLMGAIVAVVAARLLLRAGLRIPRVRVAAALLPASTLVVICAVSLGDYRLPTVMVPNGAVGSVLVPIENSYAYLAPLALPALVGTWALVVAVRVTRRLSRTWRMSRATAHSAANSDVPVQVTRAVHRVAARMGIDAPPVGLTALCPGGASVVGVRRPTVVIDADLVDRLDTHELEGVVAHELAHVRRRDNLVALVLSVVRDVLFFVPGGRWALRQLLVEREMAADQVAVSATERPGALAGGLLKVLEGAGGGHACAALLPQGTLVRRVNQLVDDRPPPTRVRTAGELSSVGVVFALVVLVATTVPRVVAGGDPDGGLGVLLSAPQADATNEVDTQPAAPRVFETYRHSAVQATPQPVESGSTIDDDPGLMNAATLRACAAGDDSCVPERRSATLGLRPQPPIDVEDGPTMRWHAHPVVDTGDVLRIYWLSSVR